MLGTTDIRNPEQNRWFSKSNWKCIVAHATIFCSTATFFYNLHSGTLTKSRRDRGTVIDFLHLKGFGFVLPDGEDKKVFFHRRNCICLHLSMKIWFSYWVSMES